MISITEQDYVKIILLDKLLASLDVEELKQLSESQQVVAKLKGGDTENSILQKLIIDHNSACADLISARSEILNLKSDMQMLIRALNSSLFGYNADFNNLKQKHNVY